MRSFDLDAFRAAQEKLQKQLEPVVATQQAIQSIVEIQRPVLELAASSFSQFAKAFEVTRQALPRKELINSFTKMADVFNATKFTFDIPEIVPYTPIDFGHFAVEVLEDEEHMIPAYIPNRPLTDNDRDSFAKKVANELYLLMQEKGMPAVTKKTAIKPLAGAEIQKIVIVRPEGKERFQIVINEDYTNPLVVGFAKCWQELLLIGDKAQFKVEKIKSTFDYFNTNKRCALYTKTNYEKTQILQIENGFVTPRINIEVISEKALATRINKAT